MPVIKNLTRQTVILQLNSGQTLHIPSLSTSAEIMKVEVLGNKKVEKLEKLKVIEIPDAEKERSSAGLHEKERSLKGKKQLSDLKGD